MISPSDVGGGDAGRAVLEVVRARYPGVDRLMGGARQGVIAILRRSAERATRDGVTSRTAGDWSWTYADGTVELLTNDDWRMLAALVGEVAVPRGPRGRFPRTPRPIWWGRPQ